MAQSNAAARSGINDIVDKLNSVMTELMNASRATSDAVKLLQLNNQICATQTCLTQAVQAQVTADDALFDKTATALKSQASMLEGMQKQISQVISDVAMAGKITSYLTQVLKAVAML